MKHQILFDKLDEITKDLENLRMLACNRNRNCEACPFCINTDTPGYYCGIAAMVTDADTIIDNYEEQNNEIIPIHDQETR